MTDHKRSGPGPLAVAQVEIGVAHAAGQNPDAHLASPGLVEDQVLDRNGLTWLVQDDGAHPVSVADMTKPGAALAPGFD